MTEARTLRTLEMKPLSRKLAEAWDRFAQADLDPTVLHALDYSRFGQFVSAAHRYQRRYGVDFDQLTTERWPGLDDGDRRELAAHLDELYQFGRVLLKPL